MGWDAFQKRKWTRGLNKALLWASLVYGRVSDAEVAAAALGTDEELAVAFQDVPLLAPKCELKLMRRLGVQRGFFLRRAACAIHLQDREAFEECYEDRLRAAREAPSSKCPPGGAAFVLHALELYFSERTLPFVAELLVSLEDTSCASDCLSKALEEKAGTIFTGPCQYAANSIFRSSTAGFRAFLLSIVTHDNLPVALETCRVLFSGFRPAKRAAKLRAVLEPHTPARVAKNFAEALGCDVSFILKKGVTEALGRKRTQIVRDNLLRGAMRAPFCSEDVQALLEAGEPELVPEAHSIALELLGAKREQREAVSPCEALAIACATGNAEAVDAVASAWSLQLNHGASLSPVCRSLCRSDVDMIWAKLFDRVSADGAHEKALDLCLRTVGPPSQHRIRELLTANRLDLAEAAVRVAEVEDDDRLIEDALHAAQLDGTLRDCLPERIDMKQRWLFMLHRIEEFASAAFRTTPDLRKERLALFTFAVCTGVPEIVTKAALILRPSVETPAEGHEVLACALCARSGDALRIVLGPRLHTTSDELASLLDPPITLVVDRRRCMGRSVAVLMHACSAAKSREACELAAQRLSELSLCEGWASLREKDLECASPSRAPAASASRPPHARPPQSQRRGEKALAGVPACGI